MFRVSQTSRSRAQMRREGWRWDLSHIQGIRALFPSGKEKKTKKHPTHENQPRHINNYWHAHAHVATSQNGKTIKRLSEELARRIGSRIVLCSAVVDGVCFCCFIKAGPRSRGQLGITAHTFTLVCVHVCAPATDTNKQTAGRSFRTQSPRFSCGRPMQIRVIIHF